MKAYRPGDVVPALRESVHWFLQGVAVRFLDADEQPIVLQPHDSTLGSFRQPWAELWDSELPRHSHTPVLTRRVIQL